jgi:hypothetical protein
MNFPSESMIRLGEKIHLPTANLDALALFRACLSPASFWSPTRLGPQTAWAEHAPFAFWLMESLRPNVVVELGTHGGFSYFSLCQAVLSLNLDSRCYAVDTWKGDEHAGFYGEDVFREVEEHNRRYYSAFSSLIRSTFDEALPYFADGSIDLLHIDGRHRYEDVEHDFSVWRGKLSERAVVLFHDTNVREKNFGVCRFWEELSSSLSHFEFLHGNGLGLVGVGERLSGPLRSLFSVTENAETASHLRSCYARLGSAVRLEFRIDELQLAVTQLREHITQQKTEIDRLYTTVRDRTTHAAQLEQDVQAARAELERLTTQYADQAHALEEALAARETKLAELDNELAHREATVNMLRQTVGETKASAEALRRTVDGHQRTVEALREDLFERDSTITALQAASELREQTSIALNEKQVKLTGQVGFLRQAIDERDALLCQLETELNARKTELSVLRCSRSWRLTAPLRRLTRLLHRNNLLAPPKLRAGVRAIRRSGLFDDAWYLRTYPDVAAWRGDPVLHYLMHGAKEERNPGPQFDAARYLRDHPDVRAAGLNPLIHYIQWGRAEAREVHPVKSDTSITSLFPAYLTQKELRAGKAGRA